MRKLFGVIVGVIAINRVSPPAFKVTNFRFRLEVRMSRLIHFSWLLINDKNVDFYHLFKLHHHLLVLQKAYKLLFTNYMLANLAFFG
jgi:hypothetical protein